MEVDSLVGKFFSYVCKVGGFVELPFIFKPPSPLASEKTEQEAKQWLKPQAGYFAFFKDENEEIVAVRVDLRKKMCQQYVKQGSCRWTQDKCKFWHICKSFIEGNCVGKCSRSHNFFDTGNKESTKEMGLEKLPNETVRNIVAWSLPQVCQLYFKNECKSEKCQYLHVCSKIVQGSSCKCALSHNITDPDNKKILKLYDSVPQQWMDVDFICCSILVPYEQKRIGESKYSSAGGAPAIRKEATASDAIPKVTAPPPNQAGTEIVPALAAPVAYRKTSSSSKPKQAKNVARTQPAAATKTESHVKKQSRQGKSKTFTDHLKITTAVTVVNDLTSNSCSPSSKDGLMFLNIPAKEEENFLDSSLDENNIPGVCLTKKTENRKNTNSSAAELTKAKETSTCCRFFTYSGLLKVKLRFHIFVFVCSILGIIALYLLLRHLSSLDYGVR